MAKENTNRQVITEKEFKELIKPIVGLPVSWVWRGYGSALFLEIGELISEKILEGGEERVGYIGEYGIMIEWSWRIERPKSIYFGSWSSDRVINNRLVKLKDKTIDAIDIEGRLPELVIKLSGSFWLRSFAIAEGQPQWTLFLHRNQTPRQWLITARGSLIKESGITVFSG